VSDDIVDLVFALHGEAMAQEYADVLWRALQPKLPWLADEAAIGVHPLGGVSRGDKELYLTRRAKLTLRLPAERVEAAQVLSGAKLDLGGNVEVGAAHERPLSKITTLYSPFVTVGTADEDDFFAICGARLREIGIPAQMVCGKAHTGRGQDDDVWQGYSLMLFGLSIDNSLRVQREGLGGERKRGCGIFIPHKSIAAVGEISN
jgi:CRISPR-associated protein Cas6